MEGDGVDLGREVRGVTGSAGVLSFQLVFSISG